MLANRLSASGGYSVLLLEAGGSDCHPWGQMSIGYGRAFYHKNLNWMFQTEPDAGTANRRSYWPRGKVLGGSSAINAMVYIRGQRQDFEDWKAAGNAGWGWDDVLPYFKKSETNQLGASHWHGATGPLYVADNHQRAHPLCQNFIQAGQQIGLSHNPDFNGAAQAGVGIYQTTIKNGRRMSAARAYLHPASTRRNLTIIKNALVNQILFAQKTRLASAIVIAAGIIKSMQTLKSSLAPG